MRALLALLASVALIACSFLGDPKAPSAEEALSTIKSACAVAQAASEDLPQEALDACETLKRVEIEE